MVDAAVSRHEMFARVAMAIDGTAGRLGGHRGAIAPMPVRHRAAELGNEMGAGVGVAATGRNEDGSGRDIGRARAGHCRGGKNRSGHDGHGERESERDAMHQFFLDGRSDGVPKQGRCIRTFSLPERF